MKSSIGKTEQNARSMILMTILVFDIESSSSLFSGERSLSDKLIFV
jgi:hypothetical protein